MKIYPILGISRESGDAALLLHEMTSEERALFSAMDSACVQLPEDTELEVFHARVAQIGALHGLSAASSVALWTRLTFALFEPQLEPDSSVASGADSSVTAQLASNLEHRTDSSRCSQSDSSVTASADSSVTAIATSSRV